MATARINLTNGLFNGKEKEIYISGWKCTIGNDGTIFCNAVRKYADGWHSIQYKLSQNGFFIRTLITPKKGYQVLKKGFITHDGKKCEKLADGIIGLSGGHIDSRYAYWRDKVFLDWLENHHINKVVHVDPNGVIPDSIWESRLFETDGKIERFSYENPENNHSKCFGATWRIDYIIDSSVGESLISGRVKQRILITLEDPMSLDIPELRKW